MSIFHTIFDAAFLVLQGGIAAIGAYQVILSLFGLYYKREPIRFEPQKRFAVLIAAHNEEQVVGPLIDNLKKMDYPKELYDIYVICDNCTDKTADVVRSHGAIACERFDDEKKGKGYAIEWMLERLWEGDKEYDAVVMFDADNLVSPNFLREMNDKLCQGKKVLQGYLDIKNPFDSWVSVSMAISYWFTNRMWQLARYNLGLSCALGGTGLCIDMNLLKEIGWGATSLTEDLEFGVRCVQRGIYPTWVHSARVFDEKPVTLRASMRQRLRWMQGHFNCASRFMWPLLLKSLKERNLAKLDAALYLFQPMRFLLIFFTSLLFLCQVSIPSFWHATHLSKLLPDWFWLAVNIGLYLQIPYALWLERVNWKAYVGILIYPIFALTWIPVTTKAYFTKHNKVWSHTIHTRAIRVEDLQRINGQ
jgi:cellulose synthase/poly-beta-1,6-N-acetylglucosamine synthase-like glycosyltransferase